MATILPALFTIGLGLVSCLWGYRLFRVMLAFWGLALGAVAGLAVQAASGRTDALALFLGALIGAVLGGLALRLLYYLGVFVVGATAGALLGHAVASAAHMANALAPVIIGAITVGALALVFKRIVIILATAFTGAWAVVNGGATLFGGRSIEWLSILPHSLSFSEAWASLRRLVLAYQDAAGGHVALLVVLVLLFIAGVVVQFRTGK